MKKIQYYILTKSIGLYLNVLSYINLEAAKNKAYQLFSQPRKGKIQKEKLPKTLQNVTYETFLNKQNRTIFAYPLNKLGELRSYFVTAKYY